MELSQKLFDKLIDELENPEVYWDRNDGLSDEQVAKIFEDPDGLWEFEDELYMYNLDYFYDLRHDETQRVVEDHIDEIAVDLGYYKDYPDKKDYYLDFAMDELQDVLMDHIHVDMNIEELIRRGSHLCVNVVTDIEIPCSGWGFGFHNYEYDDLADVIEFVGCNPEHFAELMGAQGEQLETFPDQPEKYGTGLFTAKGLAEMWANHTTEWGRLTFCVTVDLEEYVKDREMFEQGIKIPEGTIAFFHDHMNGSCGIGGELQKDLELSSDLFALRIDGTYGYGLDDIAGFVKSAVWDHYIEPLEMEKA